MSFTSNRSYSHWELFPGFRQFFFIRSLVIVWTLVTMRCSVAILTVFPFIVFGGPILRQLEDDTKNSSDTLAKVKDFDHLVSEDKSQLSRHSRVSLRPSPSDDLPVLSLHEPLDPRLDPPMEELRDSTAMLRRLGRRNYDARFVAINAPREKDLVNKFATWKENKLLKQEPIDIKRLPFYFRQQVNEYLRESQDKNSLAKYGKNLKKKVQNFLWNMSHCPVAYTWKDLGPRFWPRYVREGRCAPLPIQKERSCSFPPGMRCQADEKHEVTLLRYYCEANPNILRVIGSRDVGEKFHDSNEDRSASIRYLKESPPSEVEEDAVFVAGKDDLFTLDGVTNRNTLETVSVTTGKNGQVILPTDEGSDKKILSDGEIGEKKTSDDVINEDEKGYAVIAAVTDDGEAEMFPDERKLTDLFRSEINEEKFSSGKKTSPASASQRRKSLTPEKIGRKNIVDEIEVDGVGKTGSEYRVHSRRPRRQVVAQRSCVWIPVAYPVLKSCSCSC